MQRLSSLGRMVASLAHQIRTPLSAAMLYGMNLSNEALPEGAKVQFSEKLLSRLRDLEQQVNDMLIFAKSGEQQLVSEISLRILLQDVQTGSEAMLEKHKVSLSVDLPEPDIIVIGNQTALASALQNLVHNAVQVSQPNDTIRLTAKRSADNHKQVLIQVSDQGPGIPTANLQQLFEPFFTTKSNGTGLGLAVVKAVAQSHQGSVQATNLKDGGACISMCLPVHHTSRDLNQSEQYSAKVAEA